MTTVLLALDGQLLDGATWLLAIVHEGIAGEGNPVAVALYRRGGIELVLAVKIVAAIALAVLAWELRGRSWALAPAIIGLAGAVTNLLAFA